MKMKFLIPLGILALAGLLLHWMTHPTGHSADRFDVGIGGPGPGPTPPRWFQHHQERQARIEELAASRSTHR